LIDLTELLREKSINNYKSDWQKKFKLKTQGIALKKYILSYIPYNFFFQIFTLINKQNFQNTKKILKKEIL